MIMTSCKKETRTHNTTCTEIPQSSNPNFTKDICVSETCKKYEAIWKSILLEKNGLDEEYFRNHIEIVRTSINEFQDGIVFWVTMRVTVGWASTYVGDSFIIKINKDNTYYPALPVPRYVYLTKEDIRTIVDSKAFNSRVTKLSGESTLNIPSKEEALKRMKKAAHVDNLCNSGTIISRASGHFMLRAGASYVNGYNECMTSTINLITGETQVSNGPCWINFEGSLDY